MRRHYLENCSDCKIATITNSNELIDYKYKYICHSVDFTVNI